MRADLFWPKAEGICDQTIHTSQNKQFRKSLARINALTEVEVGGDWRTLMLCILLGGKRNSDGIRACVVSALQDEEQYGPFANRCATERDPENGLYLCRPLVTMAPRGDGSVRHMDLSLAVDAPGESRLGEYVLRTEILKFKPDPGRDNQNSIENV